MGSDGGARRRRRDNALSEHARRRARCGGAGRTWALWGRHRLSLVVSAGATLRRSHSAVRSTSHSPAAISSIASTASATGTSNRVPLSAKNIVSACQASRLLAAQGISAGVISMHTLKPLDEATVLAAASRAKAIITVEEHSVYGGLGTTVAALLMQHGVAVRFKVVGIPDEYTVTGSQNEIFAHYGITAEGLAEQAKRLLAS